MVEGFGVRLWLYADQCQQSAMVDVRAFTERHSLDMRTPLLTVSRHSSAPDVVSGGAGAGWSYTDWVRR